MVYGRDPDERIRRALRELPEYPVIPLDRKQIELNKETIIRIVKATTNQYRYRLSSRQPFSLDINILNDGTVVNIFYTFPSELNLKIKDFKKIDRKIRKNLTVKIDFRFDKPSDHPLVNRSLDIY